MKKSILSVEERNQILSVILNSNIVGDTTEAKTVIRMAEEIGCYIKTGEYEPNTLPNGYCHQHQ